MATITSVTNFAKLSPRAGLLLGGSWRVEASAVLGMPRTTASGRLTCSLKEEPSASGTGSKAGLVASLAAAAAVGAATTSPVPLGPALALVDERMSTEGTGLPFGLSNNLLGWILLGVFGTIWSLYFIYTSDLEEDEDSGLSL